MIKKSELWIWGQDAGSHHEAADGVFKLPGVNKMEPKEGCDYLGIPNICRVGMSGKPEPPFDDEAEKIKDAPKVVWSIIGDNGSLRNDDGSDDTEAVIEVAKKYPNIVGAVMDDFLSEKRRAVYSPEIIGDRAEMLHNAGLKLWTVIYENELIETSEPYLDKCDVITFWTWYSELLTDVEKNLAKLKSMLHKNQKIYLGCYMWDYGNSQLMPMDRMKYQLELYKKLIEAGEVEGIIFCSNCIADIGLDAVEYTRKWIAENAE